MYETSCRTLLVTLILTILTRDAWPGGRRALIIGNANYPFAPLNTPAKDATDVARKLEKMGFLVTKKIGSSANVSHRDAWSRINSIPSERSRGSRMSALRTAPALLGQPRVAAAHAAVKGLRALRALGRCATRYARR
jgi:Caspase domain